MSVRYGREVTGKCQVCGYKGKTHIHHIISTVFITNRMGSVVDAV